MNRCQIGIDLVDVAEVAETLRSPIGARYLMRVFTEYEVRDCTRTHQVDPSRLASRFAAKEATMKVLRVTDGHGVFWKAIEVRRAAGGDLTLVLRGTAATLACAAGLSHFTVSLTHNRTLASAIVVARG